MKKQKWIRKGMAFVLSLAMVAELIPAMSGGANTVQAASGSGTEPSVSAYATKAQLMDDTFAPNAEGTAANYGKIVFGKKSDGTTAQEWYILGKDGDVLEDNTIIFAASPIATNQVFEDDDSNIKYFQSSFGVYASYPSKVYPNHYGASDLRVALQGMATHTSYFTSAEQGLMNATTVTTKDSKNDNTYTTTDKLYALAADGYGSSYKTIKAGTSGSTVLAMSSYWSSGDCFWLRSPYDEYSGCALLALPGSYVGDDDVFHGNAVQPASNLKLSTVLFASSAKAASPDTVESDKIAPEAAMTLRLNGTGKNIGTVTYNTTTGDIKATKGSTSKTVALVVQGKGTVNGEEKDWYYSKKITGPETVNALDIKSALSLTSGIDLSACKIWLETTDSTENLIYAVGATEVLSITSVEITGIEIPVSNTALDNEAACVTTGVSSAKPHITWTPNDSTAGYNKSYTASITLTADTGYEFTDSTTATVLDNSATSVNKNTDGTLTVTYTFSATEKRVIGSVTAPKVPTNNIFTTYYGYAGYDISPVSGSNSELGTQATVTFTDSVNPNTEAMDVTWSIANAGGAVYDQTPGAKNTFRWTIPAEALTNYSATDCQGYDATTGTITGTVAITNKAAIPVTITGTDSGVAYTGETIDVSQYFTIDSHAGTATYSLVTGVDGGTGVGTLSGTTLTVTKTGTFKIKVETLANGIYGAGEKTITLTVSNGTILYTATDYSGTYDGQPHSISVNVTNPEGTIISYSTDGENYGSDNPSFTNAGNYTVYYRITKDNYNTISENSTVNVAKAASAPGLPNSTMDVDYGKEKVSDITTLPEGWAWKDADKALTVGTAVKATAVYTGADKGNYETESVEISITRLECTHATTEVKNEKDATCTEKGYTGDTCCTVCGNVITAGTDINALGHDFAAEFTVDKEATCTEEGSKSKHCSRCEEVTEVTPIPKHVDSDNDGICEVCHNRIWYIVSPSSMLLERGVSVSNISMNPVDGKVKVGEKVTVTTNDMLGYRFMGWYLKSNINGYNQLLEDVTPQSTSFTYTFTPEDNMSLVAVYEAAGKAEVKISGSGFTVSVDDGAASAVQDGTYSDKLSIGSKVTITIVEENSNFINWTNENNKIVSTERTYTFTVTGQTTLTMSKKGTTGSTAMVEFVSAYNQVISGKIYSSTDTISFPDGPSKMGYIFKGWSLSEDEIHTKISEGETHITVTSVYEQDTRNTYTVTVYIDGVQDDTQTETGILSGTTKTVKAPTVDGRVFLYWTDAEGNILGYDASYFMQINKDIIVKAVYGEAAVEAKPVIAMTNVFTTNTNGKNKISFTVTRDIPEGYTLVEHGVLYNKLGTIDNPSEDTFVLGGTGVSKYTSTATKLSGIVTLNVNMTGVEDTKVVTRGYMIVKNSEGNDEIYYSDIEYTSYNERK